MADLIQPEVCYQIRVRGYLNLEWSEWFDQMTVEHQAGDVTALTGILADQAALYGVLIRIRNLGLPLLSVNMLDRPIQEENRK